MYVNDEHGSSFSIQNGKVSLLALPIFDCRLPIPDGHWKELARHSFNRQSTIVNRQSARRGGAVETWS
jgi:hypothetical protein